MADVRVRERNQGRTADEKMPFGGRGRLALLILYAHRTLHHASELLGLMETAPHGQSKEEAVAGTSLVSESHVTNISLSVVCGSGHGRGKQRSGTQAPVSLGEPPSLRGLI